MYFYLVIWSGGYEQPQYASKGTENAALKVAKDWIVDFKEGEDTLDILRIDARSGKIDIRKNLDPGSKRENWEPINVNV